MLNPQLLTGALIFVNILKLDDWLTVLHHSITFYHQLDAQTSC
jgi:hypothetical protein